MTNTKLERIAWLSARDRYQALAECSRPLDGAKAVGADGVTKLADVT